MGGGGGGGDRNTIVILKCYSLVESSKPAKG